MVAESAGGGNRVRAPAARQPAGGFEVNAPLPLAPDAARPLAPNLWKVGAVRALFWTHFISSVLIPFYRDWGGLSFAQILWVNAWFMVWNFLLEIPTGTIADRFGRKASLALGCFVGGFAALVYVSAPSLPRFLVAEVLFAASFTLLSGADEALIYDTLVELDRTEEANRLFARLANCQLGGIVVGALLGSVIMANLGLRAPLALQSLPMIAAGLLALSLVEPRRHSAEQRPRFAEVLTVGVRTFFRSPPLIRLALHMVAFATLGWMIIWLYQPLLERAGIPLPWFGAVHTGMCLGQMLVLTQADRFERLLGSRRRLLLAAPLVAGFGYCLLAFTRSPAVVVVAILATAAFGLTRPPLFSGHLNRHIASHHRATVLSTVAMWRTLAVAIANPLVGTLADRSLGLVLALLGIASFGLLLALPLHDDDLETSTGIEKDQSTATP